MQWTLCYVSYVGLVADALLLADASFSDSFPEPCPTPEYSDSRQGPGIVIRSAFYGLCRTYLFLYRTSDVFQHFLRIITSAGPQDRKDHTQYLAGYHNQRLHLFERIIRPCRVIYMQFLKFLCMGHRSLRFPMPYCNHGLSASLHARSPGFPLPPGG